MIKVYFGKDTALNQAIQSRMDSYHLEYQVFSSKDIDTKTLMEWLFRSTDIFELLSTKMLKYKLNTQITLSQFVRKILKDVDSSLKLPIVVTKEAIYSNMTPEYVGTLLPKEYRKAERENLFRKFEKLDEGRRFWRNFEVVRKQSELRWFELHKLLFADVSDDLGEMKKAKDRFFKYKKNKQIPPEDIIENILEIFLIERVDLFQKSVSDLQNF
jgi:conserved domain protein